MNSSNPLNSLENYRGDIGKFGCRECCFIIERQKLDLVTGIEGRNDLWVVGGRNRARGTPMKRFFESDHFLSVRDERCQLKRILIGLRSRVAKEELIVRIARYFTKLFRQRDLHRILDAVGIEGNTIKLFF